MQEDRWTSRRVASALRERRYAEIFNALYGGQLRPGRFRNGMRRVERDDDMTTRVAMMELLEQIEDDSSEASEDTDADYRERLDRAVALLNGVPDAYNDDDFTMSIRELDQNRGNATVGKPDTTAADEEETRRHNQELFRRAAYAHEYVGDFTDGNNMDGLSRRRIAQTLSNASEGTLVRLAAEIMVNGYISVEHLTSLNNGITDPFTDRMGCHVCGSGGVSFARGAELYCSAPCVRRANRRRA